MKSFLFLRPLVKQKGGAVLLWLSYFGKYPENENLPWTTWEFKFGKDGSPSLLRMKNKIVLDKLDLKFGNDGSPPPNENFSWITDNLAFIFGAGQRVRLSCTPDLGCLVVVEKNWHFDVDFN